MLYAWGLRLAAWSLSRLVLEAWGLQLEASYALRGGLRNIWGDNTLMFSITYILN